MFLIIQVVGQYDYELWASSIDMYIIYVVVVVVVLDSAHDTIRDWVNNI